MSFDLDALCEAVARHGRVARVAVAETRGSVPREAGAALLVWQDGQEGTIGGGRLEQDAVIAARGMLAGGGSRLTSVPLGPALGQCCGGSVTLVCEVHDMQTIETLKALHGCIARPVGEAAQAEPLAVTRHLAGLRNGMMGRETALVGGWLVEPVRVRDHDLWIWGAGHVGRAIVDVMAPLDAWKLTWIDTHAERFPPELPNGVELLVAADTARAALHAPETAHHLILTYSHALDLEICHALLTRGFASAGLIGSATKWARFRNRLEQLGHSSASMGRITCPIGDPTLGKAPQAIAVGVAASLLKKTAAGAQTAMDRPA